MNNIITPESLWKIMLAKKSILGYNYGFTIPFVVGAYYKRGFLSEEDLMSSKCIGFVFTKILETVEEDNPVKLFDCSNVHSPILQYVSTRITTEEAQYIIDTHPNLNKKIYWNSYFKNIHDFESLVNEFWNWGENEKYSQLIIEHRFSRQPGKWEQFNEDEEEFIKNL